jgi:hypothetical protein
MADSLVDELVGLKVFGLVVRMVGGRVAGKEYCWGWS